PLFLFHDGERTFFASSIHAVLAYDEKSLRINSDAVACFLSHSFIPAMHTVWEGIGVFPPAHYGVINDGGALSLRRYWSFANERLGAISVAAAELEVRRVLDDSVRRCLDA